ncbi:MAG: MGMT family protein [Candidatus Margulisbacteria bacterium]|nr:MGMT family protein [Candidatus Margulisiibacteriota bacterium]
MASSELFEQIYKIVRKIPKGKVTSYGVIAKILGVNPRVVGYALHRNPSAEKTPCHRVVFKDGSLTPGYVFGGEGAQRELLQKEGVKFNKSGQVDQKYLWNIRI